VLYRLTSHNRIITTAYKYVFYGRHVRGDGITYTYSTVDIDARQNRVLVNSQNHEHSIIAPHPFVFECLFPRKFIVCGQTCQSLLGHGVHVETASKIRKDSEEESTEETERGHVQITGSDRIYIATIYNIKYTA